jgi:predicted enzyme related to lactoylglutathione lyase
MRNAINWFEIPVLDMNRATKFYSTILDITLAAENSGPVTLAVLPHQDGVGGALIKSDGHKPSSEGVVVYLNGGEDLSSVLDRVEDAGGKIVAPKFSVGEHGYVAWFQDTEGNTLALHSMH